MGELMEAVASRIRLERRYAFREPEEHRAEDWSSLLWEMLHTLLAPGIRMEGLKDADELASIMSERLVNYAFSRVVVSGCYWLEEKGIPEDALALTDGMLDAVDDVLDVADEQTKQQIAYFLSKICTRISREQASLNQTQSRVIRRFALANGHRCYLCGCELHFGKERPYGLGSEAAITEKRDQRTFEIEHMWAQERGGSRSRANLAACCASCNKLKSHLISFVDFPIEQIITNASSEEGIKAAINKQFRLALLWKQKGCCGACERHFFDMDTETMYLVRREKDQPMHFLNLQLACAGCNDQRSLEGVLIRA